MAKKVYNFSFTVSATMMAKRQVRSWLNSLKAEVEFDGGKATVIETRLDLLESQFRFKATDIDSSTVSYLNHQWEDRYENLPLIPWLEA
jgi:hypothetical protein